MCTHLHWDHVGWNTRLLDGRWVPTFPNAKYIVGRTEYDYWDAAYRRGDQSVPLHQFRRQRAANQARRTNRAGG